MPGLEAVDLPHVSAGLVMEGWVGNAYLDGLLVQAETGLLVDEEILDLDAVVALELDHLAHTLGLGVTDDGAIAGWEAVSHRTVPFVAGSA